MTETTNHENAKPDDAFSGLPGEVFERIAADAEQAGDTHPEPATRQCETDIGSQRMPDDVQRLDALNERRHVGGQLPDAVVRAPGRMPVTAQVRDDPLQRPRPQHVLHAAPDGTGRAEPVQQKNRSLSVAAAFVPKAEGIAHEEQNAGPQDS